MDEKPQQTPSRKNLHAIILGVLGIIFVIIGEAIINIPHAPLRGSGAGTALVVLGIILLIVAFLRFVIKRSK
jgi:hypothetical protein